MEETRPRATLDPMDIDALRARIRDRRLELGLTQVELAHRSKVDGGSLSRLERGAMREPLLVTVWRLSRGLGVPLEWLITGVDPSVADPRQPPPELAEFLDTPKGRTATPEERAALLHAANHPPSKRRVTVDYLSAILTAMRGALEPDEAEKASDFAESVRNGSFKPTPK